MEPVQKKQKCIDSFFPRFQNRTTADGTVLIERVLTVSTEKVELKTQKVHPDMLPKTLPCGFSGCSKTFGNKGARETHRLIKHPGQRLPKQLPLHFRGTRTKFPIPFWKMFLTFVGIGMCWKADMDVDFAAFKPWTFEDEQKKRKQAAYQKPETRQRFTNLKKAEFVETFLFEKEKDPTLSQDLFCSTRPFDQSCLSRWIADKERIFEKAADTKKRALFSSGYPTEDCAKFPLMETSVFMQFKARRKEGRRCSPTWFKKTAMREMLVHYPLAVSSFCASNGWFVRFCNCFGLVLRKKTNKKVAQFHGGLRRLIYI